jgi:hypothetical protein
MTGLAVGVIAMITMALQTWDGWQVPGWDDWWVLDSRQMDLAHQAVLLRFCRLALEQGFTYLAVPAIAACGILKIEEMAKENRALHVAYSSLKLVVFFGLLHSAMSVICAGYTSEVPAASETQLRNAWFKIPERFWDLVEQFILPAAWFAVAVIIWRFDSDWNAVPVDFDADASKSD